MLEHLSQYVPQVGVVWSAEGSGTPNLAGLEVAVTDMDGTFLCPHHSASPTNLAAVQAVEDAGLKVVFATGRNRMSAQACLPTLDLSRRPGVYLNGAVCFGADGSLIHERTVPVEVVVDICEFVRKAHGKLSVVLCRGDEHFVPDPSEPWATHLHRDYADPFPRNLGGYDAAIRFVQGHDAATSIVGLDDADLSPEAAPKRRKTTTCPVMPHLVHVVGSPESLDGLRESLLEVCADRIKSLRALPTCLSLLNPLCSKADGLQAVLSEVGSTTDNVIAFGDAENDLEMLQEVRVGVAMANAMDVVRSSVTWTCQSNRSHGVGLVLQEVARLARREACS